STFHITTVLALAAVHPARQLCGASRAANTYSRAGPYEPRAFRKTEDSSAGFPAVVHSDSRRALTARGVRGLISQRPPMDTATSYLGFRLPRPFIAGTSPFGFDLDTIKRLED